MALSNKTLQSIDSLDFNTIKQDLKLYLSNQDTFRDYDFSGSGLSVLLDILAYNTHHMGFYANMLANEAFLDSCVLRSSAVSLSKSLGYSPRSRRGAEITVDVYLKPTSSETEFITLVNSRNVKVLKNELFSTSFNSKNYFFYSAETYYFEYEGNDSNGDPIIVARNVLLREGRFKTETFLVNQRQEDQKFILSDLGVDERSITVFVKGSVNESEGITESWRRSVNIVDNDSDSRIFFVQETYDGKFEVYFGDGVLGKPVENGNIILVTYASCLGTEANGIGLGDNPPSIITFSYLRNQNDTITTTREVRVKRDSNNKPIVSAGGQEKETKSSIQYYAPKFYESQDRAVTLTDYIALLQQTYSGSIRSIYAWGGEDNDPPEYGKVFISVRPTVGLYLTTQEKLNLEKNILSQKNIVTVKPSIKDPEYIFISPSVNLKYQESLLTTSVSELRDTAIAYIRTYGANNLSAFEKNFYSGEMIRNLLDLNTSIKSCTLDLTFYKKFTPIFNSKFTYSVSFENTLDEISSGYYINSSIFYTYGKGENSLDLPSVRAYFRDNGRGKVSLYQESDDSLITDNYGTIDYTTGKLTIKSTTFLLPSTLEAYEISVFAKPLDEDVFSKRNTILEMDAETIQVTLTPIYTTRI
jgi:hypothetical protein